MSGRWFVSAALVLGVRVATAAPGPTPLDQPDLDGMTGVSAVATVQQITTSPYDQDIVVPLVLVGASGHLGDVTVGVQLATLAGFVVADVTGTVLYARPIDDRVTVGVGAAFTSSATNMSDTGGVAHALPRDAHHFFARGQVLQVHGDLRWQVGELTVQGQLGIDDYLIADWRDQALLRVALATTAVLAPGWWMTAEGTALSDVIDEEWDEGADLVGTVSLAVRTRVRRGAVGLHVARHHSLALDPVPASTWTVGVDAAFPLGGR